MRTLIIRVLFVHHAELTAAMIAADQGLVKCLRFLVKPGTDLTITTDSGDNALMMAAIAGRVDYVKHLIEHCVSGSSLNEVNNEGETALMLAATYFNIG